MDITDFINGGLLIKYEKRIKNGDTSTLANISVFSYLRDTF